jgi:hypothetical protein
MVRNAEPVESFFGYWPLFCDGKIKRLSLVQPGSIGLLISYMDAEKGKRAEIELTFSGVTEVELTDLRSENVLDALHISDQVPAVVTLEACYGLAGSFKCVQAEVSSFLPER